MTISSKVTYDRIEILAGKLRHELEGFQLGRFLKYPELGIIDLPLFGIRFKLTDGPTMEDDKFTIMMVPNEDFIKPNEILLRLAARGYLRWLRQQMSSYAFFRVLGEQNRWQLLIEEALKEARELNRGEYLINYYRSLLNKPLMQIYNENQETFDWIVR